MVTWEPLITLWREPQACDTWEPPIKLWREPQACKGFGRRLQGHRLVDRVPAFVVRTRENKESLDGVGGHRVATPLQRDVLP